MLEENVKILVLFFPRYTVKYVYNDKRIYDDNFHCPVIFHMQCVPERISIFKIQLFVDYFK